MRQRTGAPSRRRTLRRAHGILLVTLRIWLFSRKYSRLRRRLRSSSPRKPGQNVGAEGQSLPLFQRLRLAYSHFFELRPDGNARIRSKNVGRKADVRIFPGDVAHDAKRLLAMGLGFAGIAQNNVEDDMNARPGRSCAPFPPSGSHAGSACSSESALPARRTRYRTQCGARRSRRASARLRRSSAQESRSKSGSPTET